MVTGPISKIEQHLDELAKKRMKTVKEGVEMPRLAALFAAVWLIAMNRSKSRTPVAAEGVFSEVLMCLPMLDPKKAPLLHSELSRMELQQVRVIYATAVGKPLSPVLYTQPEDAELEELAKWGLNLVRIAGA